MSHGKRCSILIFAVMVGLPGGALAHSTTESHYCSKPNKPFQFESQFEVNNWQDEVSTYKSCITDFVEEQESAVKKHSESAQDAIDEWNSFVNYDM